MSGSRPCPRDDLTRVSLRDLAGLPGRGQLSAKPAGQVFRVNERYQDRDVLTGGGPAALGGLRPRLRDVINPCPVRQSGERVQDLNAKFADREHSCHRIGKTVTWYGRPRGQGSGSS